MDEGVKLYHTRNSPSFAVRLGRQRFQAANGILRIPLDKVADMEQMIKTRADIRANVQDIDAISAAAEVKRQRALAGPQARQGAFDSGSHAHTLMRKAKQEQQSAQMTGKMGVVLPADKTGEQKPL